MRCFFTLSCLVALTDLIKFNIKGPCLLSMFMSLSLQYLVVFLNMTTLFSLPTVQKQVEIVKAVRGFNLASLLHTIN